MDIKESLISKKRNNVYLDGSIAWFTFMGGVVIGFGLGTIFMALVISLAIPDSHLKESASMSLPPHFNKGFKPSVLNNDAKKMIESLEAPKLPSKYEKSERIHKKVELNQIKHKLNTNDRKKEGSRELSDFEKYGGWRFTREIFEIAKSYPKHKIISEYSPHIIYFEEFLTDEEVEHLIEISGSHMKRSKVVSSNKKESDSRTSYGAWLTGEVRDKVVKRIEKRIHDVVGVPREFAEGIYVLRYQNEQKYEPHTDNCAKHGEPTKDACLKFLKRSGGPKCGENHGGATCGDRLATFIMYLKAPDKGGETVFPKARITQDNINKAGRYYIKPNAFAGYCIDDNYLKVAPKAKDAILFWDYVPREEITDEAAKTLERYGEYGTDEYYTEAVNDPTSLHGGCPVLEGEKWIATRWFRSTKFM